MARSRARTRPGLLLAAIGPGLLVAATGVGAGDLLTAALAGSAAGIGLAWAAWIGAVLKACLTEGVARWQLASGLTLLEGWVLRLGRPLRWVFLVYLLLWSLFTGGALVNACGVAGTAVFQIGGNPLVSKIAWGVLHSVAGLALVLAGGYRVFERVMAASVAVMVAAVLTTAVLAAPDAGTLLRGLVVPSAPAGHLGWLLGVLGGVGGTVTLLSYGYWIREEGREGASGLRACRIDLAVGYGVTALFGVAMIVIGSRVSLERGPLMALDLAGQLEAILGPAGRVLFLAGFWGAVFSSLLGVWQSAPYLFADLLAVGKREGAPPAAADLAHTPAYRWFLVALAIVPLPLLFAPVRTAQLVYAVFGALFMPALALSLLILNHRRGPAGERYGNGPLATSLLVATLLLFGWIGGREIVARLAALAG